MIAFLAPATFRGNITIGKAPLRRAKCAQIRMLGGSPVTRRDVLQRAAIGLGAQLVLPFNAAVVFGKEVPSLETELTQIVMSRSVLNPVGRYIRTGQWDRARTNVNYCTRVLALKKRIRKAAEYLEGDAYYTFLELATELEDTLVQLDATVYTPIFISGADDDEYGVSVEQRKYQNDAVKYYDTVLENFDVLFNNVPDAALQNARDAARKQKYEIPVEES